VGHTAAADQTLFGLLPDPHASVHLLAADGEGAQAVLELLTRSRSQLNGRITIVYADTGPADADFARRLCRLDVDRVLVLPSVLGVVGLLSAMIETAKIGARIYAAGTDTLIGLVIQLAEARGLEPLSVIAEHRSGAIAAG
jgi:dimethylamine monooxygenase subunit C